MNLFFPKYKKDLTALGSLSLGLFLTLSLASFNPQDPSFNSTSVGGQLEIHNYFGYFGSFLSDLMYQFFGLGAWLFVVLAIYKAAACFFENESQKHRVQVFWAVLLTMNFCALLSLYFSEAHFFQGQILSGGVVGLLFSENLSRVFNHIGASVVLWLSFLMLAVFFTEKTVKDLTIWPFKIGALFFKTFFAFFKKNFRNFSSGVKYLSIRLQSFYQWLKDSRLKKAFKNELNEQKENHLSVMSSLDIPSNLAPKEMPSFPQNLKKQGPIQLKTRKPPLNMSEGIRVRALKEPLTGFHKKESSFPLFNKSLHGEKRPATQNRQIKNPTQNWTLPSLSLLDSPPSHHTAINKKETQEKTEILINKLAQFRIKGEVVDIKIGPAVTMFEFKPHSNVKVSAITNFADDLCLALSSESVRIVAPIPGRNVVGIEISNPKQKTVYLKESLEKDVFLSHTTKLPISLGKEAVGHPSIMDLRKMPHLLVAGTTGSGKSVFMVSTIVGLLFKHSPKTLKFILVDPKQVDLAAFNAIPHLLMPPIHHPKKAVKALDWAVKEMEKRYRSFAKFGARGIEPFNEKVAQFSEENIKNHRSVHEKMDEREKAQKGYYYTKQPYIVIVVEEFGDLMSVDKNNVESRVVRLAQMARASGIHLILATQSPRKDVVTGLIKTNIPARISFKVASKLDSRIILDDSGAERLLSRGDMLFMAPGLSKPERHHGAFVSEEEILKVVSHWSEQNISEKPSLKLAEDLEDSKKDICFDGAEETQDHDERYDEIFQFVATQKFISASLLQRRFRLGYPRAARLIEIMESEGVVGPANGSKPREVLANQALGEN